MGLRIRAEHLNGTGRLVLDGELDMAERDAIHAAFAALEEFRPNVVIVDITALSFIDSTGLRALIRAHQHMEEGGRQLTLVGCGPSVQRVLDVSGLDTFFDCFDGSWAEMEQGSETWEPIRLPGDARRGTHANRPRETRRLDVAGT